MKIKRNSEILPPPVKGVKGIYETIKQRIKASDNLFSRVVPLVRQSIEAIFNCFIKKPDIRRANKVRITKGLMIHTFGRLAAAFIYLAF